MRFINLSKLRQIIELNQLSCVTIKPFFGYSDRHYKNKSLGQGATEDG